MAVAPTGAIYKALEFDGVSSRTYGVYITGEAVYNAPERDVEMITIPGRSGSFALDNGRFENITVTYPAGIFAETEADFREAISEFRNFLCSRKGYVRLQDEYNPNEYRMAVYKSGLEVEPAMLKAGEFEITFDCKPQRWLTSGEEPYTIPGGNLIPYPYEHSSGRVNRGITFTVSADGSISMSGTGDTSLQPFFSLTYRDPFLSSGTEYLMAQDTDTDKSFVIVFFFDSDYNALTIPCSITYDDGTTVNANRNNITLNYNSVNHKWCKFTFTSDEQVYTQTDVRLVANAGNVSATVKPTIRRVSKGKNLLPFPYVETSSTQSGITFTVNDDLSVSAKGLASAATNFIFSNNLITSMGLSVGDKFIVTDGVTYDATGAYTRLLYADNNVEISRIQNSYNLTITADMFSRGLKFELRVPSGVNISSAKTFKPMIRRVSETNSDYVGYNGVYNPTLFPSRPMLEVYGYGDVSLGSETITVNNLDIGDIELLKNEKTSKLNTSTSYSVTRTFNTTFLNNGDAITLADASAQSLLQRNTSYTNVSASISATSGATATCTATGNTRTIRLASGDLQFVYGTPKTVTGTATVSFSYKYSGSNHTGTATLTLKVEYNGSNQLKITYTDTKGAPWNTQFQKTLAFPTVGAYSTKSALGNPTYIDFDIGVAWKEDNGVYTSLNNTVEIPAELPTLKPGGTTITYDGTVTRLDVVTRWWKV